MEVSVPRKWRTRSLPSFRPNFGGRVVQAYILRCLFVEAAFLKPSSSHRSSFAVGNGVALVRYLRRVGSSTPPFSACIARPRIEVGLFLRGELEPRPTRRAGHQTIPRGLAPQRGN